MQGQELVRLAPDQLAWVPHSLLCFQPSYRDQWRRLQRAQTQGSLSVEFGSQQHSAAQVSCARFSLLLARRSQRLMSETRFLPTCSSSPALPLQQSFCKQNSCASSTAITHHHLLGQTKAGRACSGKGHAAGFTKVTGVVFLALRQVRKGGTICGCK